MEFVRTVGRAVLKSTRGPSQHLNAITDKDEGETPRGSSEARGTPGEAREEQQLIDVKVEDEDQKDEDEGVVVEWRPGQQPTRAQREAHAAVHIPYAPWCGVCIEGQGRDESHRRQLAVEGPPIVELDY
eukprot:13195733-Heterocapsa_arctica.AAC.1